jgi:hypothetical protein
LLAFGTALAGGTLAIQASAGVFPCTQQGILGAIATGGGPHTFTCAGPMTVPTTAEIVIDNNVILDGEGNLTVDGGETHRVFFVNLGVTAELRGMTVSGGNGQGASIKEPSRSRTALSGGTRRREPAAASTATAASRSRTAPSRGMLLGTPGASITRL